MSIIEANRVGETHSYSSKVTDALVRAFAKISGDFNPLHLDDEHAKETMFGERIAHGALVTSFVSAALAEFGGGTVVYLNQNFDFVKPVYIGDEVTATVEVVEENEGEKGELLTDVNVTNGDGETVVRGTASILIL